MNFPHLSELGFCPFELVNRARMNILPLVSRVFRDAHELIPRQEFQEAVEMSILDFCLLEFKFLPSQADFSSADHCDNLQAIFDNPRAHI